MVYVITLLVRALDRLSFFLYYDHTDFWMCLGQFHDMKSHLI